MSRTTLADDVYARLKRQIISLRIQPGASLTEGTLAKEFALSKTPVREALARLQREGLVNVSARSGYRVSAVTLKDTRDVCELRTILEAEAAALAAVAPNDPAALATLTELGSATFTPDDNDSISDYLQKNTAFHTTIARMGGNLRLARTLEGLLTELERVIHLSLQLIPIEMVHEMEHNHAELIDAISCGDVEAARSVSLTRNRAFEKQIVDALINSPIIMRTNLGGGAPAAVGALSLDGDDGR